MKGARIQAISLLGTNKDRLQNHIFPLGHVSVSRLKSVFQVKNSPDRLVRELSLYCKQPVYAGASVYTNGVEEELFKVGFCLPAGPYVTDDDVHYIVDCIKEAIVK